MRTPDELRTIVDRLLQVGENECVEFKQASDNFSTHDIGKYFSALSNEANLRDAPSAWLVFGVDDATRTVVGTTYRREPDRLQSIKQQIADGTDPSTSFIEVHELIVDEQRLVLFEIPPAPRGIPIGWQTHYYARNGESLTGLSVAKLDEIRNQSLGEDWSAVICNDATLDDLDPEAVNLAREIFIGRHRDRIDESTMRGWDTATFLDRAHLTIHGGITRACLLLLGKEHVTALLNPFVAEMSWKLEGPELAYEHFHPPFLLSTTRLYQRIRNVRLSFLPAGVLIPIDVPKYDQRVVLEALHNCVAHQDYTRQERILVIERPTELVFQNAGAFFDGSPMDYVLRNRTPSRYRNRFLVEAMVQLRLIDTMGFGIREIMYRGQANRFLPMPDFDSIGPTNVVMRLQGRFIDENYSRALLTHTDLSWSDLVALDAIQKGKEANDADIASLRQQGLIEGRRPHLHVASSIAAATDTKADYIRHRAFDDQYYCDLILDFLRTYGKGRREDFSRLLEGKFSDLLSQKQKDKKIHNLLQRLRREGKIVSDGRRRAAQWQLTGD